MTNRTQLSLPRNSIGFDLLFSQLDELAGFAKSTYPPYNIVKSGEDTYYIELAATGVDKDSITATLEKNVLTVSATPSYPEEAFGGAPEDFEYVHKGLSTKQWEQKFKLAENVEVKETRLKNGILYIVLNVSFQKNINRKL